MQVNYLTCICNPNHPGTPKRSKTTSIFFLIKGPQTASAYGVMAEESKFHPEECTFIPVLEEFPEKIFPNKISNRHTRKYCLLMQGAATTTAKDPQKFQTLALSNT